MPFTKVKILLVGVICMLLLTSVSSAEILIYSRDEALTQSNMSKPRYI